MKHKTIQLTNFNAHFTNEKKNHITTSKHSNTTNTLVMYMCFVVFFLVSADCGRGDGRSHAAAFFFLFFF